jgi:TolA-binding protein
MGGVVVGAKTWYLEKGKDWREVSKEGKDKYLLAVAETKKLVNLGQTEAAQKAFDKIKEDYPQIAGPDLDAFIKAEMYFCRGKLTKAARAYNKFLANYPRSGLYDAVMERRFSIAKAFLAGEKKRVLKVFKMKGYAEGEKIMDRISDKTGDSPVSMNAIRQIAESFENRGKFDEAYYRWSEMSSRWPTGQTGKEALLGMGRCKHAGYKGPKYDASNLISAKSYYENFKGRYPEDAKGFEISEKLKQIEQQRAYKEFSTGQYYQKTGNTSAANLYYQMVKNKWPKSTAAQMAEKAVKDSKETDKKEKKWQYKFAKKIEKWFL